MPPDHLPTALLRLKEQLFNQMPLVGGWLRRRAAASLASDGSSLAVEILASALDRLPDAQVQQVVARTVESVQDASRIDAVCRAWAQTRSPGLQRLIIARGWVASGPPGVRLLCAILNNRLDIINNSGASLVTSLLTACEDRDATLAERALDYLSKYTNQNAIDELCAQWTALRRSGNVLEHHLSQAVQKAGYIATRPAQARVLSALKNSHPEMLSQDDEKIVPELIKALDDQEKNVAVQAAVAISRLTNHAAQQTASRVIFALDHPALEKAVLQGGYYPDEPVQRASFYFLTGQWARYESLDYDHSLLLTLYESAGSALRERLKIRLRQAGRAEYLTILTGRDEDQRISQMSPSELELLVQMLVEQQQWPRLWSLVLKLPLAWSLRVVQMLSSPGLQDEAWQPEPEADRMLFNQLIPLATIQAMEACKAPAQSLPPALERARVRLVHGHLNDVAFHPSWPRIAICTTTRRVVEWDFQCGQTERMFSSDSTGARFEHSIGEVTYTRHGTLIFAERTRGNEHCRVYASQDGTARPIFTETGSITSLEPASQAGVLLTGRSQFATLLDLDGPAAQVKRQVYTFWPRAACTATQKPLAALLHHGVELISLPDLTSIARSATWNNIINCGAFSASGEELMIGRINGEVRLLSRRSRFISQSGKQPLATHKGCVVGVQLIDRYGVLVSAGSEGLVKFNPWSGKKKQGHSSQAGKLGETITALHFSADESFMALTHSDSDLSLWDLRVQELPRLLTQPLSIATPVQMSTVSVMANENSLPEGIRQAAQALLLILQHRFRFDIEIEALAEVKSGEFDIEIG